MATERTRIRKRVAKKDTINTWQNRWQIETRGAWTRRLIPVVGEERRGTGFPSNPSVERTRFLRNIPAHDKKEEHGRMPPLQMRKDDAEHTLFECPKWEKERRQTQ